MSFDCSEKAAFLETVRMSLILIIGIVVLGGTVTALIVFLSSTKQDPKE